MWSDFFLKKKKTKKPHQNYRAHYLSELRISGEKPAGWCKAELSPVLVKGVRIEVRLGEKQRQNKVKCEIGKLRHTGLSHPGLTRVSIPHPAHIRIEGVRDQKH